MEPLISFIEIKCGYGDTEILHGVTGHVEQGKTLGVFGRNGVGKTTLSRVLVGEIPLLSGTIKLKNKSINTTPSFVRRRNGIGYMPQTNMVFDSLTVRENLSLSSQNETQAEPYFEVFPRLAERLNQQAGSMSGGERKILAFVRSMLEDTKVVVLDEPSEGVQPENIEKMQHCIRNKQDAGVSFILIEQNLGMLMSVADMFLGLDSGRVIFEGSSRNSSRDQLLDVLSV